MNWPEVSEAFGYKAWSGLSASEYLKELPEGVAKDAAIFVLARLLFLVSESGIRISAGDLSDEWNAALSTETVLHLGESAFSQIKNAQSWFAEKIQDPKNLVASWPEISALTKNGETPDEFPILITASGHLYLHRSFLAEHRLISAINRLMPPGTEVLRHDDIALAMAEDLKHSPEPLLLNPEQIKAVALAGAAPLTLLTGGPGTGKTTTVVNILRALRRSEPKLRIALAAPTGRAAVRLGESVAKELRVHPWKKEIDEGLSLSGQTLHSLLGVNDFSSPKYHRLFPLPVDFLVVDEATMADLKLLAHTFEALSEKARILLVGDPAQLPSVETGSVFADLLPTVGAHRFREVCAELTQSHRHTSCPNLQVFALAIQSRSTEDILKKILNAEKTKSSVEAAEALGKKDVVWFDSDESKLDDIL
ncbi:MAG: AAA family ATPase, partial [Spirochaetia bacterium]|nr:AAA family ATPase [Spirochaetia bacterium]